jgi:hypothetical protein
VGERVGNLTGSFVHSSENGIEYELEDEYDSGTIARLERLFFRSVRICWRQSIGQFC